MEVLAYLLALAVVTAEKAIYISIGTLVNCLGGPSWPGPAGTD